MASETDKTTIVGKWLKALGAEKYTKVFFEQGYEELDELTKDVIERLVEDKPLAAKLVALAAALNDLRPGPNPQPGPDPAPGPLWALDRYGERLPSCSGGTQLCRHDVKHFRQSINPFCHRRNETDTRQMATCRRVSEFFRQAFIQGENGRVRILLR